MMNLYESNYKTKHIYITTTMNPQLGVLNFKTDHIFTLNHQLDMSSSKIDHIFTKWWLGGGDKWVIVKSSWFNPLDNCYYHP